MIFASLLGEGNEADGGSMMLAGCGLVFVSFVPSMVWLDRYYRKRMR